MLVRAENDFYFIQVDDNLDLTFGDLNDEWNLIQFPFENLQTKLLPLLDEALKGLKEIQNAKSS